MIINRFVIGLRNQDWATVFIEIVVLIVGVFLGIQVSNWNEDRLDAIKSQEYLRRIQEDMKADLATYADRSQFWKQVFDYGQSGLAFSKNASQEQPGGWEQLLAFFQASQVAEFYTQNATFEELKSGGELGLISDVTLLEDLVYYYANADNPILSERPVYRERIRSIIPVEIQSYIWENCWQANEIAQQQLVACAPPKVDVSFQELVGRINRDDQLMGDLRYWMSTMLVARVMLQARESLANEIIDDISTQLAE